MNTTRMRIILGALFVGLTVVIVIAVTSGGDTAKADGVDRAFTGDMVPHHVSAVDMAEIAKQRSKRPEIQGLADDIIRTQQEEIDRLRSIDARLKAAGEPKGKLGASAEMMGMSMDTGSLKTAEPFDRAFIDMMIPHHQGAVRMSRIELDRGADGDAKKLAEEIIAAQTREIEQMNAWRKDWFGAASPAGGVPKAGDDG
ncbi:MAG: hypothetical protein AVDCRST_MAG53-892 [uncultured Solirubrobacteraceae bacterium]|uniref:DUF305 domain-containing protein n=1 Tax=uncultured Solirubrobacteraceae bacterium TaxID=1162706 RepID=A0A6J4RW85_9ACTN|nr:MAG: hypothetical protein AVDCRST_MAG53-892 [uncultured Solirubrobacteraceae bacterium]